MGEHYGEHYVDRWFTVAEQLHGPKKHVHSEIADGPIMDAI